MSLSPEEAALFGEVPTPVAAAPAKADDFGWDDEPVPAKPSLIMPDCKDCGASLTPENGSQLRGGEWKHIGCPKAPGAVALVPSGPPTADIPAPSATEPVPASFPATPEPAPATVTAEAPKRRGRPPKAKAADVTPEALVAGAISASEALFQQARVTLSPPEAPHDCSKGACSVELGQIQTLAPTVLRIELGPETLAVLRALLAK